MALIDETLAQMRAELAPALDHVTKLVIGIHNWQRLPLSEEARLDVDRLLADHQQDQTNIEQTLLGINSLERLIHVLMDSGYPDLGKEPISPSVRSEIDTILKGLQDASGEFATEGQQAAVAKINLGTPQPQPKKGK